jgi:hypothetical protein
VNRGWSQVMGDQPLLEIVRVTGRDRPHLTSFAEKLCQVPSNVAPNSNAMRISTERCGILRETVAFPAPRQSPDLCP